jgi:DNA-binding helix-turn-helix protein
MSMVCSYISAKNEELFMNVSIERKIGDNIRKLREKIGFTQEYVATKLQLEGCDITRSALAKIEVGQRHLYPDEIIFLKKILRTNYEEIFSLN